MSDEYHLEPTGLNFSDIAEITAIIKSGYPSSRRVINFNVLDKDQGAYVFGRDLENIPVEHIPHLIADDHKILTYRAHRVTDTWEITPMTGMEVRQLKARYAAYLAQVAEPDPWVRTPPPDHYGDF